MKICIFGAGAIGGHLAARLHRAGAEVCVVARGAHLAAIRANGLTIFAVDGTHHAPVRASANPAELGKQDAVFVTVKAPALPAVAASIEPLLGPDTPVAFVMNGTSRGGISLICAVRTRANRFPVSTPATRCAVRSGPHA